MVVGLPSDLRGVRSALFLPASSSRAIAKARTLPCDMAILDLEDAVPAADKEAARQSAVAALSEEWGARLLAIRINPLDTPDSMADLPPLAGLDRLDALVLPKVERAPPPLGRPVLAMIETPAGLYAAREIAAAKGVVGLIAGVNDLAASLGIPDGAGREPLALACQMILLAARAAGVAAFDGVYNRLDDAAGFAADATAGRALGFDGKTLIHPSQIEPCNRLFSPSAAAIAEAEALIAAAGGGAERFRGRMIEGMHVAAAHALLARARAGGAEEAGGL